MRIERPKRYHPSRPLPTVERLRSNISSKIPAKIHYRHGNKLTSNSYNLSYRRPLLSDDYGGLWEPSHNEEDEEVDDVTPITPVSSEGKYVVWKNTPRTPTISAVKKPMKKVLRLPSLRGNGSYSPRNNNEAESRDDDDHQYLLRSMNEEKYVSHRQYLAMEPTTAEEAKRSTTKKFKQLHEDESSGVLQVVDFGGFDSSLGSSTSNGSMDTEELMQVGSSSSSSEKENKKVDSLREKTVKKKVEQPEVNTAATARPDSNVNTNQLLRMSTDSLDGLRISQESSHSSDRERASRLKLSQGSDPSDRSCSKAFVRSAHAASSVFGYSTDSNTNDYYGDRSLKSSGSSSTVDFDSHLTPEEKITGVHLAVSSPTDHYLEKAESDDSSLLQSAYSDLLKQYQTPIESVATESQQSFVTYTSVSQASFPVLVTPTENGDVILLTPMDDMVDIGPQPKSAQAVVPKLLIPTLGSELQDDVKVHNVEPALKNSVRERVDASQIKSVTRRKKVVFWENVGRDYNNEASPTGVDELLVEGDIFVIEEEQEVSQKNAAKDMIETKLPSKPPLPPSAREDSEFIASEDWNGEDDSVSNSSSPFGSYTIHDPPVIELRDSLESDCGESSSIVSSSIVLSSVVSSSIVESSDDDEVIDKSYMPQLQRHHEEEIGHRLSDMAMDEDSKGSSLGSHCASSSLGSFSQIFTRGLPEDEHSDSESDEPGDYFDFGPEFYSPVELRSKQEGDLVAEAEESAASDDVSESSGETPDFMRDLVQQQKSTTLKSIKPWANDTDNDCDGSDCDGSDLISAPSGSLLSSDSKEDASSPVVTHVLSGELEPSSDAADTDGKLLERLDSDPGMKDFDNLNNFWVHEWKEMAVAAEEEVNDVVESEEEVNVVENEGLSDPDSDQPRFLLKKDVGDAMSEEDEQTESGVAGKTPANMNICTDCDGNAYLKIYDLDSGADVYEVIEGHHELETVEECSSKEEEGEEGEDDNDNDKDYQSLEKSRGSELEELNDLWSKIDEYSLTQVEDSAESSILHTRSHTQAENGATPAKVGDLTVGEEAASDDVSESSGETPDFMRDLVQPKATLKSIKPWAKNTDIDCDESDCDESDCDESDLISAASASLLSSDSKEDASSPVVHQVLSGESEKSSDAAGTDGESLERLDSDPQISRLHTRSRTQAENEATPVQITVIGKSLKHGDTANPSSLSGLEFRRVKSSKKRYIHVKKRAIAKAKSQKIKYDLNVHLEKATSHHEKEIFRRKTSETSQPSLALNTSLDGILTKALDALTEREYGTPDFEGEELAVVNETSSVENEDENSFFSSSVSIATFTSMVLHEESEKDVAEEDVVEANAASEQSEKNDSQDNASVLSSCSHRPEIKGLLLTKLYDENVELAETLASTQSELEKVNRTLEVVKMELDEIMATARFEI